MNIFRLEADRFAALSLPSYLAAVLGGPSLIGAWAVHFFAALGMTVVGMWLLRPLTRWQVSTAD